MKPVLFRKKHDAAAAEGLPKDANGSMKALAWLLVNAAAADWWSLVNDNALRVTDELIVGAVLTDRPGGLAWNEGWPAEGRALCFRLGSREACRTDLGPARRTRGAASRPWPLASM